jgi:hypothetical protein
LEDLFDLHESSKEEIKMKHTAATRADTRNCAEGEAICKAGLGFFVAASHEKENSVHCKNVGGCNNAGQAEAHSMDLV